MFKKLFSTIAMLLIFAGANFAQNIPGAAGNPSPLSRPGGEFYAAGFNWQGRVISGNSAAGVASVIIADAPGAGGIQLSDGTTLPWNAATNSLTPLVFDFGQGAQETVTPTAVSISTCPAGNLGVGGSSQCMTFTGTFVNTHGQSAIVQDGTFGLQTALNYANMIGGGNVVVDTAWAQTGGTNALLAAAVAFGNVGVTDLRTVVPQYWSPTPTTASFLAVPTTLTAVTALPSATPVGTYTTGTYHLCVSYVDIMGNEGPCSLDFSEAGLATGSFIFTAPAASTGAVGYTVYISLTGGTYALSYQVPLTNTICRLTTVETITPACAVTSANYNQTGATATVTAITVNTSPLALQLGAASTTSDYVGNSNARTTYAFASGGGMGIPGIIHSSLPFTAGPATVATTVPQVIGTVALPTGFMNQIGKTIRVCGKMNFTGAAATIETIQFWWDGAGSDAAGVPVLVGNVTATGTGSAVPYNITFCETLFTTVAGAGVTAGSIEAGSSYLLGGITSTAAADYSGFDNKTAAVGSLNLAGGAGFTSRLHVVQLHTGGTDVSPQLVSLTVEAL